MFFHILNFLSCRFILSHQYSSLQHTNINLLDLIEELREWKFQGLEYSVSIQHYMFALKKYLPAEYQKLALQCKDARGKTQVAKMVAQEGLLKPSNEVSLRPKICHAKTRSCDNYLDINTQ